MSLKKYLRSDEFNKGQSTVEYFILLALVTAFAIIGSSGLFSHTRASVENYTNAAADAMAPETE